MCCRVQVEVLTDVIPALDSHGMRFLIAKLFLLEPEIPEKLKLTDIKALFRGIMFEQSQREVRPCLRVEELLACLQHQHAVCMGANMQQEGSMPASASPLSLKRGRRQLLSQAFESSGANRCRALLSMRWAVLFTLDSLISQRR